MKKLLLLCFSLLSIATLFAQSSADDYIPLVVEGVTWSGEVEVEAWTQEQHKRHPYTIKIQGDSIINNIRYKKCHYLFNEFNQEPNQYTIVAYLREDINEKKVYAIYDSTYMPPINTMWEGYPYVKCLSSGVFNEVLLYDFSDASNPDLFNSELGISPSIKTSEITTIDGVTRKIHQVLDNEFYGTCDGYFIEGIGYASHVRPGDLLFRFPVLAACLCNTTINFLSFHDENGTLIFSLDDAQKLFNGVESIAIDTKEEIINIGAEAISTDEETLIEVVDLNGRKVASVNGTKLSISNLPAGLYIVRATTSSATQTSKVIVK